MRAIIIEDKDAKALLDKLKLVKFTELPMRSEISKAAIDYTHRQFHYVVTKWLQEQGCDVTSSR
jgi:phage terminase large subunit GpA-like protein